LFKKERWTWAGGLTIILLTAEITAAVTPVAAIVGMVYGLQAWQKRRPRFYLGVALCFYLAAWAFGWEGGPLPEPEPWLVLSTILSLIVIACYWRLISAIPAILLIMLSGAGYTLPHGSLQWGVLILVIGFTALIVGIIASWSLGGGHPTYKGRVFNNQNLKRLSEQ
jgi:hypothetical protein